MFKQILLFPLLLYFIAVDAQKPDAFIRVNQLGYTTGSLKVAVYGSLSGAPAFEFELVDAQSDEVVFTGPAGKAYGEYGPFKQTYRFNFSAFKKPGNYLIRSGSTRSPVIKIGNDVYDGAADFCLRYMRQQRSGYNPFLKDSCHKYDGYALNGPFRDSMHIDVVGGWHDASDYLQYSATSSNATWHLLAAFRDFREVFSDQKLANGNEGTNGTADVLDEARWGLTWLLKMHPKPGWLFNQIGDDRDHRGMRIPKEDTNFYGKGFERPVYFCNGKPQQRGKFMNNTTGVSSTAGKFSAAFALGSAIFFNIDKDYAKNLSLHAASAYAMGLKQPGAAQTVSVLSPYIYAEDNWTDDMELAAAAQAADPFGYKKSAALLNEAYQYALQEPITPWFGTDTARHYQWYPFVNVGHYELARSLAGAKRDSVIRMYKEGIEKVWNKSKDNAFFRGIPFIWCSNILTVSFATQCYWYRQLTNDSSYLQLEQACFDWIFGCNPWGTSMVYGLPSEGDSPIDPHSAFTHVGKFPIDGGLVDGPVYTSIYKNLIGITLYEPDEYEIFQSGLAVYHDDYGDYSTNEPTMDGTASLIYLLAAQEAQAKRKYKVDHGGIVRGDKSTRKIALVFTADEYADGLPSIIQSLKKNQIQGSFFFTGNFLRNKLNSKFISELNKLHNYIGPHSDKHLLYCDWEIRDSLLISKTVFIKDMENNIELLKKHGINIHSNQLYIPPYEWWNDSIAYWSREHNWQVINFTPGIRTNADYTYPEMGAQYKSTESILESISSFEQNDPAKLNGAIILFHAGTDSRRNDKLYSMLDMLIQQWRHSGYQFVTVDELLH